MTHFDLALLDVRATIALIDKQRDDVARQLAARPSPGDRDLEWAFLNSRLQYLETRRHEALELLNELEQHQYRPELLSVKPKALKVPLRKDAPARKRA